MRKTPDFSIFADLRLAGVGMIGVVHATRTIDAIQRFIGRIELGMIPQIIDTVIQIEGGQIKEIYTLQFKVKTPSGMTEADLARPVIEVYAADTGELRYEIYTFGEQVVVMEVGASRQSPTSRMAQRAIEREVRAIVPDADVSIEVRNNRVTIRAPPEDVPYLIGKGGKVVSKLESRLGMKVDIIKNETAGPEVEIPVYAKEQKKYILLSVDKRFGGQNLAFTSEGKELFSATTNKKGVVKVEKKSDIGYELSYLLQKQKFIYASQV
jgi:ATPase